MTAGTRLGGSNLPLEESKKPLHSSQPPLALQSTTALQEITKTVFREKRAKKAARALSPALLKNSPTVM